jgi:hypothetical protein
LRFMNYLVGDLSADSLQNFATDILKAIVLVMET